MPTSLRGIAYGMQRCIGAKRATLKSPVRENCTPGFVRGHPGDRVSYLDSLFPLKPTEPNNLNESQTNR